MRLISPYISVSLDELHRQERPPINTRKVSSRSFFLCDILRLPPGSDTSECCRSKALEGIKLARVGVNRNRVPVKRQIRVTGKRKSGNLTESRKSVIKVVVNPND